MVRNLTHRAHWLAASTLKVARPIPVVLILLHLFFFALIERYVPVLIQMKDSPESFLVNAPKPKVYNFSFGHQFGKFSLASLERLGSEEIKEMILSGEKGQNKARLEPLVYDALKLAEFYELDPFWFISIMKVESHFKNTARSIVNAQGLMQIMPNTAIDIFQRMNRQIDPALAKEMMGDERINMEMGAYYLKYLLKKFNYNYKFATIAYNMGPYWVIRRNRESKPVGVKNFYWTKVNKAYRQLTRSYRINLRSPQRVPSFIIK